MIYGELTGFSVSHDQLLWGMRKLVVLVGLMFSTVSAQSADHWSTGEAVAQQIIRATDAGSMGDICPALSAASYTMRRSSLCLKIYGPPSLVKGQLDGQFTGHFVDQWKRSSRNVYSNSIEVNKYKYAPSITPSYDGTSYLVVTDIDMYLKLKE